MIYVVDSPGRTGSKFLVGIIACLHRNTLTDDEWYKKIFYEKIDDDGKYRLSNSSCTDLPTFDKNEFDNSFIHTHYHLNELSRFLDPSEVTMILSKRRSMFDLVMSKAVATEFQHWVDIPTDKNNEPFELSVDSFNSILRSSNQWEESLPPDHYYATCVSIYYEDIISHGYSHVAETLGMEVPRKIDKLMHPISLMNKKSSFNYKDYVTNWQQLFEIYQRTNT